MRQNLTNAALAIPRWLRRVLRSQRRRSAVRALSKRWSNSNGDSVGGHPDLGSRDPFERITVRVINLEHRDDRLARVSEQLDNLGVSNWERVLGVNGQNLLPGSPPALAGSIGCELAHIAALAQGTPSMSEAIMVCEDDLEFLGSKDAIRVAILEFLSNPRLDVMSLSGRPRGGNVPISENLRLVIGLVGRGCYLVKPHTVNSLVSVFATGLKILNSGSLGGKGDLVWRALQEKEFFFVAPRRELAQQAAGFSDIERKNLGPR